MFMDHHYSHKYETTVAAESGQTYGDRMPCGVCNLWRAVWVGFADRHDKLRGKA